MTKYEVYDDMYEMPEKIEAENLQEAKSKVLEILNIRLEEVGE